MARNKRQNHQILELRAGSTGTGDAPKNSDAQAIFGRYDDMVGRILDRDDKRAAAAQDAAKVAKIAAKQKDDDERDRLKAQLQEAKDKLASAQKPPTFAEIQLSRVRGALLTGLGGVALIAVIQVGSRGAIPAAGHLAGLLLFTAVAVAVVLSLPTKN